MFNRIGLAAICALLVLLFAALFLHEPLDLKSALGTLLIVAGAIVLAVK